jgi:hypothetical protein
LVWPSKRGLKHNIDELQVQRVDTVMCICTSLLAQVVRRVGEVFDGFLSVMAKQPWQGIGDDDIPLYHCDTSFAMTKRGFVSGYVIARADSINIPTAICSVQNFWLGFQERNSTSIFGKS